MLKTFSSIRPNHSYIAFHDFTFGCIHAVVHSLLQVTYLSAVCGATCDSKGTQLLRLYILLQHQKERIMRSSEYTDPIGNERKEEAVMVCARNTLIPPHPQSG